MGGTKDAQPSEAALGIVPVEIELDGEKHMLDLSKPELPGWLRRNAMESGDYPYNKKLKKEKYERELQALQIELVKLQAHIQKTGGRIMALFEGRDAAGKGGTISVFRQYLNPRYARNVALSKPTETERGQWYFQRYVDQFPTAGEIVTFDRSWYNRGVVEPVMGFCTPEQSEQFLQQTPAFEKMIADEGIHFFKFWLNIGREMQLQRFHDRIHSPLKWWKFSPVDVAGIAKWQDYTEARNAMIAATDSTHAPWLIVRANDKRRSRIAVIRQVLASIDYEGRDQGVVGRSDPQIIGGVGLLD
jgi:polyphosphate kinase 2